MNLPDDIIKYIVEFANDIDIRIQFKIFEKINLDNYQFINSTLKNVKLIAKFVEDHNYMLEN